MNKQMLAAALLVALVGCAKPTPQNAAALASDPETNITDIVEVPDESADANAADANDRGNGDAAADTVSNAVAR